MSSADMANPHSMKTREHSLVWDLRGNYMGVSNYMGVKLYLSVPAHGSIQKLGYMAVLQTPWTNHGGRHGRKRMTIFRIP